jgi:hypothetical protein
MFLTTIIFLFKINFFISLNYFNILMLKFFTILSNTGIISQPAAEHSFYCSLKLCLCDYCFVLLKLNIYICLSREKPFPSWHSDFSLFITHYYSLLLIYSKNLLISVLPVCHSQSPLLCLLSGCRKLAIIFIFQSLSFQQAVASS